MAYTGEPLREHATGVIVHGIVEPGEAEAARHVTGPDHPAGAWAARAGHDRRDGDRVAAHHCRGDVTEFGEAGSAHRLDEDLDYAAAGEPDGERVVVADAIGLQQRLAGAADLTPNLVHGSFDAPA